MIATALAPEENQKIVETAKAVAPAVPRRFFVPDINRHLWLIERLRVQYGIDQRQAISWLRSLIESSEFLFLYQANSVALAEVTRQHTLAIEPVLTVRFVWIAPISDGTEPGKEMLAEAALFFDEFAKWAKNKNITTIILEDGTLDVPREQIRETRYLGRLFRRETWFAKVA